ncbi:MAG TPA: PilZ domain-containing protein [Myxococcaceae bacterium]|nr:PilZ domain-containing protein [Myxococcaceae bacterium]
MSVARDVRENAESDPVAGRETCFVIGASEEVHECVAAIEAAGFACVLLATAAEVASALDGARPALILVHEAMASREGARVFAAIREHEVGRDVPVVVLASPQTAPELIESAWKAGADDCILQPLAPEQVRERVGVIREANAAPPDRPDRERRIVRQVAISGDAGEYGEQLCDHLEHEGLHLIHLAGYEGPPQTVDVLVYVTDTGENLMRDLPIALKRVRTASPTGILPILAISRHRKWSNPEQVRRNGIYLLDGDHPVEDVVRAICGLLHRAPHRLRVDQRIPFFCPVYFREAVAVKPGDWRSGFTYNLSAGGLFIKTLVPLRPAAPVEIRICLTSSREEIDVTGVVAWSNRFATKRLFTYPVGMGVQFLGAISRRMAQLIESCRAEVEP